MPYTTFSFYQEEFCGNKIPTADEYQSAAVKAKCYLDWLTNGKIRDLAQVCDDVKMAECALSEIYWGEGTHEGIVSESNDGYSVKFCEPNETELYRSAVRYLPDDLVYRGIGI